MPTSQKTNKALQSEIAALRNKVEALRREKADLELILENSIEHADSVEDDLINKVEFTLRESERRFRMISETIPLPIFVTRLADHAIVYANKPTAFFLRLPLDELLGRPITDFYDPQFRGTLLETLKTQRNISNAEIQGRKSDGELFWGALSIQPLTFNEEPCLLGALFDLTERKEAEEQLKQHHEELERLVAERTSALSEANKKLSEAIKQQEQRTLEMTVLNSMSDLLHACRNEEETHAVVLSVCKQLFSEDSGYLGILDESHMRLDIVASWGAFTPTVNALDVEECWALRRGKSHIIENSEIGPLCRHLPATAVYSYLCEPIVAQGEILGVMQLCISNTRQGLSAEAFRQLSDTKQLILIRVVEHYSLSLVNLRLRETLRKESIQDPLTGLYNRRYMKNNLEKELSRCKRHKYPLSIIMIDIDHFKTFNDAYGHAAGDLILQKLGYFLKTSVREEDVVCRYGGEEFALIFPQSSLGDVEKRAEKLRIAVKEQLRISYHDNVLGITISLGIAGFPEHGKTLNELLRAADQALYRAKDKGRDRVEVAEPSEI